jgi:hypothetical protein
MPQNFRSKNSCCEAAETPKCQPENWSQLDWVKFFYHYGGKAILLIAGGKTPLEKGGWLTPYQSYEEFEQAYLRHPGCNAGIVCDGELIGVDIDYKPAKSMNGFGSIARLTKLADVADEVWELEEVLNAACTLMVRTPNDGVHVYYSGDHQLSGCNGTGHLAGVDIRAAGKHYLVCPGATLSSGGRYTATFSGSVPVIGKMPARLLKSLETETQNLKKRRDEVVSRNRGKPVRLADYIRVLLCYDPTVYDDWMRVGFVTKITNIWDDESKRLLDDGDPGIIDERRQLFDRWARGELHEPPLDVRNYGGIDELFESADSDELGFGGLFFVARERQPGRFPSNPKSCLVEVLDSAGLNPSARDQILQNLSPQDLAIAEVNERFALVTGGDLAGHVIEISDPFKPRPMKSENFNNIWRDKWVTVGPDGEDSKRARLCNLWRDSPDKRKYESVVFQPPLVHPDSYQATVVSSKELLAGQLPEGVLNTWNGFAIEPKCGDAHLPLVEHIRTNICGGEELLFHWVLSFMADMVQRPGRKPGVALGIRGGQGVGKSVITEYLMKIFGVGRHAFKTASDDDVIGDKNGALQSLILCVLEEAIWAGNPKARGKLKDLITADVISVRQLYRDPVMLANHMRMIVLTNESWMTHVDMDDRRWAILEASDSWGSDLEARREYFGPIQKAKAADGPACLLHFLLRYPYDPEVLASVPVTRARTDQQKLSMTSVEAFLFELLGNDYQVPDEGDGYKDIFNGTVVKQKLFNAYLDWASRDPRSPVSQSVFGRTISDLLTQTSSSSRPTQDNGTRPNCYVFADRLACQREFADSVKMLWENLFG